MENKWIDEATRTFEVNLPPRNTLDEYLELILREVRPWSEDLSEKDYYVSSGGKPWQEIRDDTGFHEVVLHFFNENGEYLQSVDGNVSRGKWRLLDGTNKMIIESGQRAELYELAFLTETFFILKKHGGRNRGYFCMGHEPYVAGLEWRDYVELIFNSYRSENRTFQNLIIAIVVVVAIIIFFMLF